jgi:hypothetical protein
MLRPTMELWNFEGIGGEFRLGARDARGCNHFGWVCTQYVRIVLVYIH